ncbi:PEP-CTERM sorting domain-containing protein [Coraliomargarita algicola]|uniref:PEP-CTERM sorting domain-containing protein n=1 Tax=Coraliomargarita algicola TaxID=3092156 RepID=A0ABZ0RK68_9BACT|nr:PEP-CTERM sorting domain-containing protein [Coraliomargarita sp. J2-16]WPJ96600.1 PEP-CTERM sorting domain-containing protein [Coraliomargarita sp. J2-16]
MKHTYIPIVLLSCVSLSHAEVVTFNPNFDLSSDTNTSGSTAYNPSGNSLDSGIVDDGSSSVDAVTYSFSDASTGIDFSYIVTYTATDGFLNPEPNSGGFGVGYIPAGEDATDTGWLDTQRFDADQFEGLTIAISNLNVDFTNYISGSITGVTDPTLNAATVGFSTLTLSSVAANDTQLTITDGTNTYFGQPTTTGGYSFSDLGLNITASSFTINVGDAVSETVTAGPDDRVRLHSLTHNIALDVVQIPEPSSFALFGGLGVLALRLTKRRR